MIAIPECPAFGKCTGSCEVCQSLAVEAWKEHVWMVLKRKRQAGG